MNLRKLLALAVASATVCTMVFAAQTSSADPKPDPKQPTVDIGTDYVNFTSKLTEEQCLTRAKTALEGAFKVAKLGSHAYITAKPGMAAIIECLNVRGVNAAYISVAYTNGGQYDAVRGQLIKTMKGS